MGHGGKNMKNRKMKVTALVGACILLMGSLAGCGSEPAAQQIPDKQEQQTVSEQQTPADDQAPAEQPAEDKKLSGSIQLVGSTSMEKLANALCESYMEKNPDVKVAVEFSGSGAGIEAALGGTADIGNASRNLKEEEKQAGAAENIVAIDGIAVCVDPANAVEGLSKQQLTDIYNGTISNWSEVGGEDAPIIVVGREAGSGTRGAFEELLGLEDACVYANELDSTGAVMAKVAATPGAIGYVSLDALDGSVKALPLDGVEPTAENIKAGAYFLSRPFVMVTKGAISEQSELVQDWFDFVMGAEGQEIAAKVGLITVE